MIRLYGDPVAIYTGRVDALYNAGAIDITIKGRTDAERAGRPVPAGAILAPAWKMVHMHKTGGISDERYTEQYYQLIRARYAAFPQRFFDLMDRPKITLCCFCAYGAFCHRHLAADILYKVGKSALMDVSLMGEMIVHVR